MEITQLKTILQAVLLAAGRPLNRNELAALFEEAEHVTKDAINQALAELERESEATCFTLKELASGYVYQIKADYSPWLSRLWEERPPRYSRAFLETLVIIAYRQPVSRGDIEDIRGVAVSSYIIKTLLEREWVRIVGHRDVPGKPAIFGTTKAFLDYFNLKNLADLPTLDEIKNLDEIAKQLNIPLQMSDEDGEGEMLSQERKEYDIKINYQQKLNEARAMYAEQEADLEVV